MKKKTLLTLIISAVLICSIAIGVYAVSVMEKPNEVLKYIVGLSDDDQQEVKI